MSPVVGTRSVLFTDLVGSTELRVRLGEDRADAVRRVHDALITDVVAQCGGVVVKGLGDGLLVTFESAADAVSAAVGIQQAAEAHGRHRAEEAFTLRVGLSIGDVSHEEDDVFGVPVVEASRLCAMAAGGEILAADLVRALARGRAGNVFEPMGALALKGLPEPVPACRVVWEPLTLEPGGGGASNVPVPAALGGAATGYVGREQLRERLAAEWQLARGGSARAVLLAGEPGVGKTRTAAEVARLAHADGAVALYGRCEEDLGVPYQPFVEALDHYVRHAGAPALGRLPGELVRLLPDLGHYVDGLPPPVASDPASEEFRLFEATTSWLLAAARDSGGLVLVLDDVHWATKPTLQLLLHVVRGAVDDGAQLLVLATYRDTDIDRAHPLSAVLGDMRRLAGVDRVAVDNLSSSEVLAFIAVAAGHALDDATRRLADAVYAETEGNPFFVGEVLRHLIETGAVRREDDRWVVADPDRVAIPEGVRDVVGRRLTRLSTAANEALSVAAVIGRSFDTALLHAVVDQTEDGLLDVLDEAVRARLVEEIEVDRYRFAHALVRTTLYDELSATRRRRLHRRVADALEELRPGDVQALAHHCVEGGPDGGDPGRALRYTLAAAEEALGTRAFAEAEARFRAALDLIEDDESPLPAHRIAALCGLGESQRDQGDPAFRETLLDASRCALEAADITLAVRAVLANTRGFVSAIGGIDPERIELIEETLRAIGPEPSAERARLLGMLASELTFTRDHARRLALVDEAEALARELGDDALLGDVLVTTGYAAISGRQSSRLVARTEEGMCLADQAGDPTRRAVARIFHSAALLTVGELARADAVTRDLIAIAEESAPPAIVWAAHANGNRLLTLAGHLAEAATQNDEMLALGQELGQSDVVTWWGSTLVGIHWLIGDVASLVDASAGFAEQFPLTIAWRCAQVWLAAEAGRAEEAGALVRQHALEPVRLIDEPWPFLPCFHLGLAANRLEDADLARDVVEALTPYREQWSHFYLFVMGPVTWALGAALATVGSLDEAVAALEDALAAVTARGLVAHAPLVRLDLARVLRRRSAAGDHDRANALLQAATQEARAVDAGPLAGTLEAVLASR